MITTYKCDHCLKSYALEFDYCPSCNVIKGYGGVEDGAIWVDQSTGDSYVLVGKRWNKVEWGDEGYFQSAAPRILNDSWELDLRPVMDERLLDVKIPRMVYKPYGKEEPIRFIAGKYGS